MDEQFGQQDVRFNEQLREQEARFTQRLQDQEVRLAQQLIELVTRQNEKFEELGQQIRDVNVRIGNVERGQSRPEGQLDMIGDALFRHSLG